MPDTKSQANIHILALGDSYTIGTYVTAAESWSGQLAAALRNRGLQFTEPKIIAQNGWTTRDLLSALIRSQLGHDFDLVALMIGVNDQFQGADIVEYRHEFGCLLNYAVEYAGGNSGKVLVLSIPDWSVTPFAVGFDRRKVSQEIDFFNESNRQLTLEAGANYVDISPLSRALGGSPGYLTEDGLHPSGKMYTAWMELVLPLAIQILE